MAKPTVGKFLNNAGICFMIVVVLVVLSLIYTNVNVYFSDNIDLTTGFYFNWEDLLLLFIGFFISPVVTVFIITKRKQLQNGK